MSSSILLQPQDVIETILLRLPALDLFRCKGVCKAWRSLISSADFVAAHLQRAKSDPSSQHLLFVNSVFNLPRRPGAGPFSSFTCLSSKYLFIAGSVNGLLCVAGKKNLLSDDIWILNPVTGLSRKLPFSSRFSLGTYPNIKFAFWCDDDGVYKLAKIVTSLYGNVTFELWVSTSPDTWTVISTFESVVDCHARGYHACDVLIEGLAAYWIVIHCGEEGKYYGSDYDSDYDKDYESDGYILVLSLNLKTLALSKITPFPKGKLRPHKGCLRWGFSGCPNSLLFGEKLNGEFVLVVHSAARGRAYDIWTLTDDTVAARWTKKFTLYFDSFPFKNCFGIVNDKLVLTSCEGMIVALCDPLTGMLEVVETGSKLKTICLNYARGFVGSLVSIDGFGFECNDLLRKYMTIRWPHSLYPSAWNEDGWRMKSCKKQTRKEEGWRMKSCKKQRKQYVLSIYQMVVLY